jgi:predicted lipoprotein with Yx(FWY)xxD motif
MRAKTALAIAALTLAAACGSSSSGKSPAKTPANRPAQTSVTVSSRTTGAGMVLVDSSGRTLYATDQDAAGKVACVSSCTSEWPPLTVPAGTTPTGSGLNGQLGTLTRPDGMTQVAYNGRPLYRFTEDRQPGDAHGNGAEDDFEGVHFHWHALTMSGAPAPTASPSKSSGGGYGGY